MQNSNNFIRDITKKQLNGMLEDKEKMLIEFKYLKMRLMHLMSIL